MTSDEAARVLEVLAKGIDPETGEDVAEDSPFNKTPVVRALFLGALALRQDAASKKARRVNPEGLENAWLPWTTEEETRLIEAFDQGVTLETLASKHRRKIGGIKSRLIKLGKLEPR
jgi:hypothetical protein